ncbi:NERD domain-containing protein [Photobacterium kishitanii]|uniref:nuclease-related domain-containing protein n=1 Tax=Photobacterium kishitanii TaxID=318456 RepID=UPI0005E77602|nr:nuclease-related domain-containing protein [Photobacterium kishitanii]KJG10732.1 DNA topoisomerase I [Photobacterium kishitanii]PSV08069.1 NERD domain-containing protein [Photobacterium kishitanii]PSV75455.1 NERD domain-containing protein [Photobacterium kishitanii]
MSVFLYVFGLLVSFLLGGIFVERKVKEKQQSKVNIGEALVSKKLNDYLFHEQVTGIVVNNVTLSIDGSTTQIDHVLICTKGVFVIETKHYKGWIYGDAKQKKWTQVLFKKRSQFQNPIHQNYKHIKAIQALFDFVPTDQIKSLVVFTGDGEFKTPRPKDVVLLDGIRDWMNQHESHVFTLNRIQFCYGRLEYLRMPDNEQTDKLHLQNLSQL